MQMLNVKRDGDEYDRLLAEARADGLPENGDLQFVFKDNCTVGGNPGVMVTFTVTDKNKRQRRVQAVLTAKQMRAVSAASEAWYPDLE